MADERTTKNDVGKSRYQLAAVGLILGSAVGFSIGGPVAAAMGAGVGLVIGAAVDAQRRSSG